MPSNKLEQHFLFRGLVLMGGIVALVFSLLFGELGGINFWEILVAVGLIAFVDNFPISIFFNQLTLTSVITLGLGLIFGVPSAALTSALGILIGHLIRRVISYRSKRHQFSQHTWWLRLGFEIGLNLIPLAVAFSLFGNPNEIYLAGQTAQYWLQTSLPAIVFVLLHGAIYRLDSHLLSAPGMLVEISDWALLLLIELLPIPLILIGAEAYSLIGTRISVALTVLPAIVAVLLSAFSEARLEMQTRVKELSTLNRVSQALRSTLDLDELLPLIQEQVMEILEVENFYVALLEEKAEELWYPLAVKRGERQQWPRRSMENRLTDRVIREGRPILLTPQTQRGPAPVACLLAKRRLNPG